jgi:hypothetical protein
LLDTSPRISPVRRERLVGTLLGMLGAVFSRFATLLVDCTVSS